MSKSKQQGKKDLLERLMPRVITSNQGKREEFEPTRIIRNIMKETGLDEANTLQVVKLVMRRLIGSNMKLTTSPMIREMACAAMVELGFDQERYKYTRLGPPYFDYASMRGELTALNEKLPFFEAEKALMMEEIREKSSTRIEREFQGINQILKEKSS